MNDSQRFVEFLTRLSSEYYAVGAGLREQSNIAEIKRFYGDLYNKQAVLAEREAFLAADSVHERRLTQLRLHERGSNYLSSHTEALADEIETWKLHAALDFEHESVPYNTVHSMLQNLPDRFQRRNLSELLMEKTGEIYPLVLKRWKSAHELAEDLSYKSYLDAYREWEGLEINKLVELAKDALRCTNDVYKQGLEKYARVHVGVDANEIGWFDLPHLLRGVEWDRFYPSSRIVYIVRATARDLQIDLDQHSNIRLDLEPRKNKSPRAFCAGVRVPEEIYLVAKPVGGHRDYEAVLHEAGHAFHFGLTKSNLSWELRYLVDDAVSETFAYLIAGLLRSAKYLEDKLGMSADVASDFVSYANFIELYMFRRYCAKSLFEVELHDNGTPEISGSLYTSLMRKAIAVDVPGELGLIEMDPGLYSLQYLSAWFLHASLLRYLLQTYGPFWFKSVDASSFLKSLWSQGSAHTADSLLARLSDQALSTETVCSLFVEAPRYS